MRVKFYSVQVVSNARWAHGCRNVSIETARSFILRVLAWPTLRRVTVTDDETGREVIL